MVRRQSVHKTVGPNIKGEAREFEGRQESIRIPLLREKEVEDVRSGLEE